MLFLRDSALIFQYFWKFPQILVLAFTFSSWRLTTKPYQLEALLTYLLPLLLPLLKGEEHSSDKPGTERHRRALLEHTLVQPGSHQPHTEKNWDNSDPQHHKSLLSRLTFLSIGQVCFITPRRKFFPWLIYGLLAAQLDPFLRQHVSFEQRAIDKENIFRPHELATVMMVFLGKHVLMLKIMKLIVFQGSYYMNAQQTQWFLAAKSFFLFLLTKQLFKLSGEKKK